MTPGLRDIEYFVAIAEHGNVGRAAESLGLSQPALSKSLRRIESSMQTKLVRKVPKGIELTAVGAAFLTHVRRIRLSLDDVAHEVADLTLGRAGHLRIGANQFAVDHLLPEACNALMKSAQKITWTVTVGQNDALVPALRNGAFDLVVAGVPEFPERHLVQEQLVNDEFAVITSVTHPLAKQKKVTIADLARYQWALSGPGTLAPEYVERVFKDNGQPPPDVTFQTNAPHLLMHAVASSDLLGFQSRWDVRHVAPRLRLAEMRVPELAWVRRLGVRYRKDAYLSPAALRFIEMLKTTAKEIATATV